MAAPLMIAWLKREDVDSCCVVRAVPNERANHHDAKTIHGATKIQYTC